MNDGVAVHNNLTLSITKLKDKLCLNLISIECDTIKMEKEIVTKEERWWRSAWRKQTRSDWMIKPFGRRRKRTLIRRYIWIVGVFGRD